MKFKKGCALFKDYKEKCCKCCVYLEENPEKYWNSVFNFFVMFSPYDIFVQFYYTPSYTKQNRKTKPKSHPNKFSFKLLFLRNQDVKETEY